MDDGWELYSLVKTNIEAPVVQPPATNEGTSLVWPLASLGLITIGLYYLNRKRSEEEVKNPESYS